MSIYENAMRKEAGASAGINKIINFIASKSKGVKSLASQRVQDFKDQRYLYNRFGLKDYLNGNASYLANTADAGKAMKALTIGSVAGQKALPYVGLTALGGGMYLLGDKIVDEYGNVLTDEAQAKLRRANVDYDGVVAGVADKKAKGKTEVAGIADKKAKGKDKAGSDNYLKYSLTGGGAVLGGLAGAGIAGKGNRILGGLAGAGIGAGTGYGAYRIAKYLELA